MAPSRRTVLPVVAVAAAIVLFVSACAAFERMREAREPRQHDGVLVRQIWKFRDPFFAALQASGYVPGQGPSDQRWDGRRSSAIALNLRRGGVVAWAERRSSRIERLDVLISSGPRDAAADPAARPDERRVPYSGPPALVTCFRIETDLRSSPPASNVTDIDCPAALRATLDPDVETVPIHDFDG